MDTVYCVSVFKDYYNDIPEYDFFVCKNLYTAEQILKREYEKVKQDFLEDEEDTCFDTDDFRSKDFVLYAEDIFNCTGDIVEKQIFDLYNPPTRPIRNRLKDLIKKK